MEHILLVDDEKDLIWAVSKNLQLQGYAVSTAYNGAEAFQKISQVVPDLILLDVKMPVMSGIELCYQLRRSPNYKTLPIIFLTALTDLDQKIAAYTAGADDYVTKPFEMSELILRIRALLRRAKPAPTVEGPLATAPTQIKIGPICLDLKMAALEVKGHFVEVTPRELDLLKFMMEHPGQTFSPEFLLQTVWGYPAGTGDPTVVRWHIKNLRRKIEPLPEEPVYLRTVSRHGYIFVNEGAS